jgi:hypothetical protein
MNWDQQHEDQAGEAGKRLGHAGDHVVAPRQGLGPFPVTDPGHEEDQGDDEDQAVHEWRVAYHRPGLRMA